MLFLRENRLSREIAKALALSCLFLLPSAAAGAEASWANTLLNRWRATALLETLNAEILASSSATVSLEKWCGAHGLANPPRLVAEKVEGASKPLSPEQRRRLGVGPDEPVRYRHVRLRCGGHVLSEADNWYLPSRLTPEMNRALETTDAPFGRVVRPLGLWRRTFEAKVLWSPLDSPGDAATLAPPEGLFEHRAVLYTKDDLPFSEVDEIYRRDALDFPPGSAQ